MCFRHSTKWNILFFVDISSIDSMKMKQNSEKTQKAVIFMFAFVFSAHNGKKLADTYSPSRIVVPLSDWFDYSIEEMGLKTDRRTLIRRPHSLHPDQIVVPVDVVGRETLVVRDRTLKGQRSSRRSKINSRTLLSSLWVKQTKQLWVHKSKKGELIVRWMFAFSFLFYLTFLRELFHWRRQLRAFR